MFHFDTSVTVDAGQNYGFGIPFTLVFILGLWFMLRKAGIPGWGAIIPIYNVYLYVKLGGLSGWSIVLFLVPIVNIFFAFYAAGKVSAAFGHGWLMAIFGLVFFAPIGALVLGFGSSKYRLPRFDSGLASPAR